MSTPIIINQLISDLNEIASKMDKNKQKMEIDHMVALRDLVVAFRKEMHGILDTVKD